MPALMSGAHVEHVFEIDQRSFWLCTPVGALVQLDFLIAWSLHKDTSELVGCPLLKKS